MKILLLNPPNHNEIIGNDIDVETENKGVFPSLGLMYLASNIKNHEVKLLDLQVNPCSLENALISFRPDIVGITALTHTLIDVKNTIDIVKNTTAKIVIGGPHASIYPQETLRLGANYVIQGEGEETLNHLLDMLDRVPTSVILSDPIQNLDNLKYPTRNHLDKYWSITSPGPITTIMSSRGCPFGCKFCYRPAMGRAFRMRTPNNVVNEMEECSVRGIREIFFYDDTFTVDKERVVDICAEISLRKLKIDWDVRARVDTVDKELLRVMKRAGCKRIHFGVESGSEKIIKILNKGITLQKVRQSFRWAQQNDIETLAYFMIGCPEETKEDRNETLKLAKELRPSFAKFNIFTPFPGTDLYQRWLERDNPDVWREFAKAPKQGFKAPLWEEKEREELQESQRRIYKEFYGRFSYISRKLLSVRNLQQLRRYATAGMKILK